MPWNFRGGLIFHQNIRARERTLRAGPGKMIYLPAGTAHTFTSPATGGGERLIFRVSADLWAKREAGEFGATVSDIKG